MPRPETPGETKTAQAVTDRELRDRLRRDKVILENQKRRERGPKVGHNVFYNEVQKRLTSRLFLALGTEGKKKFVQKNLHTEVSKLEFREMVAMAKASFEKTLNILTSDTNYSLELKNPVRRWNHSTRHLLHKQLRQNWVV